MKARVIRFAIPLVLLVAMIWAGYSGFKGRAVFSYMDHLDEVAVTVDGEDITLRDMLFYVAYEEHKVEETAVSYNPDNTIEYWNIHTNGSFFRDVVKDAVMGMAVHDAIFYRQAYDENLVLTSEERAGRENARTDFWSDLFDIQRERLEGYEDVVDNTIDKIALAQKYQKAIAERDNKYYYDLDWDGSAFEGYRSPHFVEINEKLWDKVVFGDVTLEHSVASYLPALKD